MSLVNEDWAPIGADEEEDFELSRKAINSLDKLLKKELTFLRGKLAGIPKNNRAHVKHMEDRIGKLEIVMDELHRYRRTVYTK